MSWIEAAMLLVEFLTAACAVAICGPCFLACARRLALGDELLAKGGPSVREAEVLGCDEPFCPYYKKNAHLLMIPAQRRTHSTKAR